MLQPVLKEILREWMYSEVVETPSGMTIDRETSHFPSRALVTNETIICRNCERDLPLRRLQDDTVIWVR